MKTRRHGDLLIPLALLLICLGCDRAREARKTPSAVERPAVAVAEHSRALTLVNSVTIFVLAIFVGFEVITKVPPTLHTPLMSGSNAISGITLVGALVAAGNTESVWSAALGFAAVILATINVVGGFMVTGRMLAMFQRRP